MPTKKQIIGILENIGLLNGKQIEEGLTIQKRTNESLKKVLRRRGYLSNGELGPSLFAQLGLSPISLSSIKPSPDVISVVSPDFAREHRIVPIKKENNRIILATDTPLNFLSLNYLREKLNQNLELVVSSTSSIDSYIQRFYGIETEDLTPLFEKVDKGFTGVLSEEAEVSEEEEVSLQVPLIRLANLVISDALEKRASDIHIEPLEKSLRIRYRIDGVLQESINPPFRLKNPLIARFKLMADMDLAESRLPQDGRIMINALGRRIDLRVSTLPALYGESLVMRILDKSTMLVGMDELGFLPDDYKKWNQLLKFAGGIILVTGPTGSGKTTTLYTSLSTLNTTDRKIMTVEEPVEYQIPGMNQTPVDASIGRTFSSALRAFLRQAPDIILIGEIRDFETADVAMRAAITGHLVFSTLHTNDAPSAITRLIDLGVPPFLVASSVQGIMAQRLVRVLCPKCKKEDKPNQRERENLRFDGEEEKVWRPVGCPECNQTGFFGRLGIFEVITVNDEIRQLALQKAPFSKIKEAARKGGMRTMGEDGIIKVKKGVTTLDEVLSATTLD